MMKSILQLTFILAATAALALSAAAQDPSWHKVPKDDLLGNRGEIAKTLQSTTDEKIMLEIWQRPEVEEQVLYLKMLAAKRLGQFGTKAAIPVLVPKLDNEFEDFYARYALETIPGEEVDAALCDATKNIKRPEALAGVLTTLGVRATYAKPFAKSAETAKSFLGHENADVRKAAAYAFALNGGDAAVEFFTAKAVDPNLCDSGFLLAEVFAKNGAKDKAIKIYDALAAADIKPYQKEAAVFWGMIVRGGDGINMLVAQLNSDSQELFEVGLKAGRELPAGAAVTKAMVEQLDKQKSPERKALLVRSIGDRKDKESKAVSLPVVAGLAKSGDEVVRVAAIDALRNIGDGSVIETLIAAANQKDSAPVAEAAKRTLANLAGKEVDDAIVAMLDKGDATAKIAAIGLVEERRIIAAFPLLQKGLKDENAEVRKAAIDAFGQVAGIDDLPMLLDFLGGAKSQEEADAILNVLKSACTRMPQDVASAEVAKRFTSDSTPLKLALIDLLKEIGGAKAVEIVEGYVWGDNAELKDRASAAMGSWRSPQDLDLIVAACRKIAKESKDNRIKRRGVSGYLRLARQFNMSEERRIQICNEVFEMATWDDVKLQVVDVYWRHPSLKMLEETMKYLGDDKLKEKACETAVVIGEKLQGKSPKTAEAMKKIMETTGNNGLKDRARRVLEKQ